MQESMLDKYLPPNFLANINEILETFNLGPVSKEQIVKILESDVRGHAGKIAEECHPDNQDLNLKGQNSNKENYDDQIPLESHQGLRFPTSQFLSCPGGLFQRIDETKIPTRRNKHVYGSKAALCFETDETRGGIHTVSIDAADSNGPKQYNWGNKLRLQATRDELLQITAILFGFLPKCEGKNHGDDNSKGFALEDQGDKLFMRLFAKGHTIKAVPISPEDAFYVATLFLFQLKRNMPWLSAKEILLTLQRVYAHRKIRS